MTNRPTEEKKRAFLEQYVPPPMGKAEELGIKLLSFRNRVLTFIVITFVFSMVFYYVTENLPAAFLLAIVLAIFSGLRIVHEFSAGVPKFLFFIPCRGSEIELKPGIHWMPFFTVEEVDMRWQKLPLAPIEVLTGSEYGTVGEKKGKKNGMIMDIKINPAVISSRVKPGKAFYSLMVDNIAETVQTLVAMSLRQSASQYANPEQALFAHSQIGQRLKEDLDLFGEAVGIEFIIPPEMAPIEDIDASDPEVSKALQAEVSARYIVEGTKIKQAGLQKILKKNPIQGVSLEKQFETMSLDLLGSDKMKKIINDNRFDIGDLTTAENLPALGNILQGIFGAKNIDWEKLGNAIGKGISQSLKDIKKED